MTVNQNITAGTTGNVALRAAGATSDININGATVSSTTGSLQAIAGRSIFTNTATGTTNEFSTAGTLLLDAQDSMGQSTNRIDTKVGTVAALSAGITLAGDVFINQTAGDLIVGTATGLDGRANLGGVVTNNNDIAITTAAGALTLAQSVSTQTAGSVYLSSSANINQTGGAITANDLGVRVATGFDANQAGNNVANLAVLSTGSGNIVYRDSNAVAVGTVSGPGVFTSVTGITTTTGGDVTLNHDGPLTLNADIKSAGAVLQSGALVNLVGPRTITSQGATTLTGVVNAASTTTLLVNDLNLTGTLNSTGAVQITPITATREITIGGAGGSSLGIDSTELSKISTAAPLTLGDANHQGAITISNPILNPSTATGSLTIINKAGGIAVNAPLTYTPAGGAALTLTANGDGTAPVGGITDNGSGLLTATNLILNTGSGIGTSTASPLHVTGTNVTASNTSSGGVYIGLPTGNLNLVSLSNVGTGTVSLTTTDGNITTGAGSVTTAGALEMTANATSGTPRTLTTGTGTLTANGNIALRAADDITIGSGGNGTVSSNGGDIVIVAGKATGMDSDNTGIRVLTSGTAVQKLKLSDGAALSTANESIADQDGSVTLNARVMAGAGRIVINATESVTQAATGVAAGLQNTGVLVVRTYNDHLVGGTVTDNRAIIDLQNDTNPAAPSALARTGNNVGAATLEARFANDTNAPGVPNATFAPSNINFKSYSGMNIQGIGTAADFVGISATQNVDVNALGVQAKNLKLIASAGNLNVNTQIRNDNINNGNQGGSLTLLAAGDLNINDVAGTKGVSIGEEVSFNAVTRERTAKYFDHDLKLAAQGDINVKGSIYLKGDLTLRADASPGEITGANGVKLGASKGSVKFEVPDTAPESGRNFVEVKATNILIGGRDATNKPVPVNNITLSAAKATQPATGADQRSDVVVEASGNLDAYLTGDILIEGGTTSAVTTGSGQSLRNSATAALVGNNVFIKGMKESDLIGLPAKNTTNFILQGGTISDFSTTAGGIALASAPALILATQKKEIDIGGNLEIRGGNTPVKGQVTAVAKIDPTDLTIRVGGNLVLIGGTGVGGQAVISNDGDINLFIGGAAQFNFVNLGNRKTLTAVDRGGLIVIGGPGSGLFGANDLGIGLGDQIKVSFLGGGVFSVITDLGRSTASIRANSPRNFDELLRYIIFAANEETRISRIRAGVGGVDDSNLPSCN